MTDGARHSVELPASPEAVDLAHEQIERLWGADGTVSAPDRLRFELAVIEILGNIVEHAWAADASRGHERRLVVTFEVTPTRLVAVLGDNGQPADLDLSAVTMPGEDAESGRGLPLAIATLDSLDYHRAGGRNVWRLACERRDDA